MTYKFTPVGWLIDEGTEHERALLGSNWQAQKMGGHNVLLVTLMDAQNGAVWASRMAEALNLIVCCLQDEIDEGRRLPQLIMKELIKKAKAALPAIAPDELTGAPPGARDD